MMVRTGMLAAGAVLVGGVGCYSEPDISVYFTVEATVSPGQSATTAPVAVTAVVLASGDDESVHRYCGPTDVFIGDAEVPPQRQPGQCGTFGAVQTGYRSSYAVQVVALGGTVVSVEARGPAVHTVSFDPAEPAVDVPATVSWQPSGEPDVRALGWYWTTSSSAGTVSIGEDSDDGVGRFTFPDRGERTFGVMRLRQIDEREAGASGDMFLTVENSVRVR